MPNHSIRQPRTSQIHSTCLPALRVVLGGALLLSAAAAGLRAADVPVWKDVTPAGLSDPKKALGGVDFGNGVFVAVGNFFDITTGQGHDISFTSADGSTWTEHALDFPTAGRVRFAEGKFYVFGSDPTRHIYSSKDGANWTSVDDPDEEDSAYEIASHNGILVAARGTGLSGPMPSVSTDGVNWKGKPLPGVPSLSNFLGVAYGAGQFALVGQVLSGTNLYTSADGQTWTAQSGLSNFGGFDFITFGNGTFLVQQRAYPSKQIISTDAVNWKVASPGLTQVIPGFGTIGQAIGYARFLNGQFVAPTVASSISASADAQNWTTLATVPLGGDGLSDLAFGAGHYVAISRKQIYTDASGPIRKVKKAELTVDFSSVKIGGNAAGTKVKFKGKLTVTNTGKRPATGVKVGAYLSDDKTFSAADDGALSMINLADHGFPTLAKKSATGALSVKFTGKTSLIGATSGKYLLIVVDPLNAVTESDETDNVFAYGPLP